MANAIRSRTVQKGIDPRGFALVAFGGAGPLHGAEVAAMLDIPEVIVPPYPGITSAMGLLTTDFKYDAVQTEFQVSGAVDLEKLNTSLAEMQAGLTARFEADHIPLAEVDLLPRRRPSLCRPRLRAARSPAGRRDHGGNAPTGIWKAFHAAPCRRVRPRLRGEPDRDRQRPGERHRPRSPKLTRDERAGQAVRSKRRRCASSPCLFRVGGKLESFETTFYRRSELPVDETFPAPPIILQN